MGKQAKKKVKSDSQSENQRRHNKATRGINTNKKPVLFDRRYRKVEEDGKEIIEYQDITVSPYTQWDPFDRKRNGEYAEPPFDLLRRDWRRDFIHYHAEHDHVIDSNGIPRKVRIGNITLPNGRYLHRIYYGESVKNPEGVILEVESSKKLIFKKKKRRKNKK